ncbi:hypothetical protein ACMS0O_000971 [Cronobacter malonaticus]
MKNLNYMKLSLSIILSVYFLFTLMLLILNGLPKGFAEYGTLGDSFGVLNSLFSGLGFAGLVYTLFIQQKQIKSQEKQIRIQELESKELDKRYKLDAYENTLYKLIDLYKTVLSEVKIENEQGTIVGRTALTFLNKQIMDEVRAKSTNQYPEELRKKLLNNDILPNEKKLIDFIHFEHFSIIRSKFNKQGRLIQTARIMFEHLELNCPDMNILDNSRDLVMSQMTTFECQYFFYYSLTNKNETDFIKSMAKSIFLDKNHKVRIIEIHRNMFDYIWGINLKDGYMKQDPMMDKKTRKHLSKNKRKLKSDIKKLLDDEKTETLQAPKEIQTP